MPKNTHIEKAKKYLDLAESEFKKARRKNDIELLQNACAKAWLATIEATYAFLIKKGINEEDLPKIDRGRRYMVTKYGDKELALYYFSLRDGFHIAGYYEGILTFEEFKLQLDNLKYYISKIENEKK